MRNFEDGFCPECNSLDEPKKLATDQLSEAQLIQSHLTSAAMELHYAARDKQRGKERRQRISEELRKIAQRIEEID
jgi:hypothetical protein